MDTERLRERVKRSNLTPVLVVGVLVLVSAVVVGATGGYQDDFEDGNISAWTNAETVSGGIGNQTTAVSANGNDSSRSFPGVSENDTHINATIRITDYSTVSFQGGEMNINAKVSNGDLQVDTQSTDTSVSTDAPVIESNLGGGEFIWLEIETMPSNNSIRARAWRPSDPKPDWEVTSSNQSVEKVGNGTVDTIVLDDNGGDNDIGRININKQNTTEGGGSGGELNESLEIKTRDFLEHNTTVPFRVYYEPNDTTQINVTSNATVTVENTSVVTVDQTAGSMTSTNDTTINRVTWVNATYQGENANKSVVVANETIENVDILPPLQKWTATFGDDNTMVILIATAVAAVVAIYASSLAGLGAFALVMMAGWLGGWTADHTVIAAILITLFVGLNVSQLVEFRRT